MPLVVPAKPPEKYGRVLRRYDRDAALPIRFTGYDTSVVSQPIEMHGRVAPTLFFPPGREAAAHRATRLGWRDETEAFGAHVRGEPDPRVRPAPPAPTPEPTAEETRPPAPGLGAVRAPALTGPDTGMAPLPAGLTRIKRSPSAAKR